MLNVLFIAHCSPMLGANRSLIALIDGLVQYGIRMAVVCPPAKDSALADALSARGVMLHEADVPWNCRTLVSEGRRGRLERILVPAVLQRQSDRIALAAAEDITKRLGHIDCIYTNTSVTDVGYFVSRQLECPHIWHLRECGGPHYGLCRSGTSRTGRQRLNATDSVVAISRSVLKYHRVSSGRAHIVANGVIRQDDLNVIRTGRLAHEPLNYFSGRFASLGVINRAKGQHVAIAAFAKALEQIRAITPEPRLDIVGPGDTTDLRRLAADLGIEDRVNFTGSVDDPLSFLATIDVHMTCSTMEGFGRVTAEAMACGAIAVGNNSGGTPEVIDHGVNGLLYGGTVDELAESLVAIAFSEKLRERLRVAALEKAASEFTIECYAGRILEILCRVCHRTKEEATFTSRT